MRTSFATIPRRVLLTYHDAYAYFARDYGWDVIGAIQVSDFEDPTPREVAALIEQVEEERVPAIFGSEVFPSPVLEQIGREAGVRYVDVLRDDDLPGEPGDAEHSWGGLMRFDYVTMTEALGGDASALQAFELRDVAARRGGVPAMSAGADRPLDGRLVPLPQRARARRRRPLRRAGRAAGRGRPVGLRQDDAAARRSSGTVAPVRGRVRRRPACGSATCRRSRRWTGTSP